MSKKKNQKLSLSLFLSVATNLTMFSVSFSLLLPRLLLSMENNYRTLYSFCLSNMICGLLIVSWLARTIIISNGYLRTITWRKETKKKKKNQEEENKMSLLDLPDLTLDCILQKLSPSELCAMSCVCSELRDKCVSDHLWEKHLETKWGRLMGDAAIQDWKSHVATLMSFRRNSNRSSSSSKPNWSSRFVASLKPFSFLSSNHGCDKRGSSYRVPIDSVMYWYSNLENGKFWFPAQVYNRENGHVGFMMSCYDAKIRYHYKTDTFQAKYSAHGRRAAEENVTWQRLRPSLIDIKSRDLHVSDCLHGLRPGDHFEIQWRRTTEFPYGWWFGIVGHLQNCDGEDNCRCYSDDNVVMEFRQFRSESPWRTTVINRKDHRETGNEANGFYGGVKKLGTEDEISTWKQLWPSQALE